MVTQWPPRRSRDFSADRARTKPARSREVFFPLTRGWPLKESEDNGNNFILFLIDAYILIMDTAILVIDLCTFRVPFLNPSLEIVQRCNVPCVVFFLGRVQDILRASLFRSHRGSIYRYIICAQYCTCVDRYAYIAMYRAGRGKKKRRRWPCARMPVSVSTVVITSLGGGLA